MTTNFKILCVDDHYINGAIIQGIFKNIHDVAVALTGQSAITMIDEEYFDLVLLDIGLPDMSGYDIATILNQKKIPFIFLSAKVSKADIEKGYEYAPLDYMKKPINGTEIKFHITKHLNIIQIQAKNKEKIIKMKENILSIFTHEMNTPLQSILTFSDYITKGLAKQEQTPKIERLSTLSKKIQQNGLKLFDFNQSFIDLASLKYKNYKYIQTKYFSLPDLKIFLNHYKYSYDKKIEYTLATHYPPQHSKYLLSLLLRNLLLLYIHRDNSFIDCHICIEETGKMTIVLQDDDQEPLVFFEKEFLDDISQGNYKTMEYTIGNIWLQNIQYSIRLLSIKHTMLSVSEKMFLTLEIPFEN